MENEKVKRGEAEVVGEESVELDFESSLAEETTEREYGKKFTKMYDLVRSKLVAIQYARRGYKQTPQGKVEINPKLSNEEAYNKARELFEFALDNI